MDTKEWIDANLRRVIASDGGNVEFINRKGKPVNYENELDEVISTLEELELAKCDKFGGYLLETGELVRDEFGGSYLGFLESLSSKKSATDRKVKLSAKRAMIIKYVSLVLGGIAAIIAIIEFLL